MNGYTPATPYQRQRVAELRETAHLMTCGHEHDQWRVGVGCIACYEGARPDIGELDSMADKLDRWRAMVDNTYEKEQK